MTTENDPVVTVVLYVTCRQSNADAATSELERAAEDSLGFGFPILLGVKEPVADDETRSAEFEEWEAACGANERMDRLYTERQP